MIRYRIDGKLTGKVDFTTDFKMALKKTPLSAEQVWQLS